MNKKILSLSLSLLLLLLSACQSKKDRTPDDTQKTVATEDLPKEIAIPAEPITPPADTGGTTQSSPDSMCDMQTVRSMNMISSDSFPRLLPSIRELTFCTGLDVSRSNITELPPEIGELIQLKSLDLSVNKLKTIPAEIGKLTQLTYLDLRVNRITTLPPQIAAITSLEQLDVSDNNLEEDNLDPEVIKWLDRFDPDWRCSQKGMVDTYWDHIENGETALIGTDTLPLYYEENMGPPSGLYFSLSAEGASCKLDTVRVTEHIEKIVVRCPPEQNIRILDIENAKPNFLILLRGIPGLKVGPVKTWYLNKSWVEGTLDDWGQFNDQENQNWRIREKKLTLDGVGKCTLFGEFLESCEERFQWRVRFGDTQWRNLPILPAYTGIPKAEDCLLWIGDIDGDSLPDMILNPTVDDYQIQFLELFLSTQYRSGRMWKPTAKFYYIYPGTSESSGC